MSVIMPSSGNTDCHTSDIGHWFAMTETDFVYSLGAAGTPAALFYVISFHSLPCESGSKTVHKRQKAREYPALA